jgi:hypothetical protein
MPKFDAVEGERIVSALPQCAGGSNIIINYGATKKPTKKEIRELSKKIEEALRRQIERTNI